MRTFTTFVTTFWLAGTAVLTAPPAAAQRADTAAMGVVHGVVLDSASGAPVRLATVRLTGSPSSVLTNDAGRFRFAVPRGEARIEVRRIGYMPASATVVIGAVEGSATIILAPIPVRLSAVVSTAEDDAAARIIRAAIARKQSLRGSLHDYRYDAHVRFAVTFPEARRDSLERGAMGETVTTAYWEAPDHFQETILARRQSDAVREQANLVRAGQLDDFSRDRISLFGDQIISPIADDALDHYRYRVLDTLPLAGLRAIRLSVEPSSDRFPAFIGVIDIVDSTFDIAGFDVGVNAATDVGIVRDFRYRQRFSDVGGGPWMPSLVEYTASVHLALPFIGGDWMMEHTAALTNFHFNDGVRPAGLDEYRVVVADGADRPDSATWAAAAVLPPQTMLVEPSGDTRDSAAYARRTPAEEVSRARSRELLTTIAGLDLFRFNRVDGWYFGVGWTWHDLASAPWMVPTARLGYATGSETWLYRVGDQFRLSEANRTWVGVLYHDETTVRPGFTSEGYNPSLRAVLAGPAADAQSYYRARGIVTTFTTKVAFLTQLDLAYADETQSSLALLPRYAEDTSHGRRPLPNPPILDGRLRTVSAGLRYDSRPMVHQRGMDERIPDATGTSLSLNAESSVPWTAGGRFDYRRYTATIERSQNLFGLGLTTLTLAGGIGTGSLPPQRYFTVDGGAPVLQSRDAPFITLGDSLYSGNRAAEVSLEHHFGRQLFSQSAIPLIRRLPFTLAVHGGVFWTTFRGTPGFARDTVPLSAPAPYKEAGFTIGNLTPWMGPLDLALRFGWQLSAFPTHRRTIEIGFGG